MQEYIVNLLRGFGFSPRVVIFFLSMLPVTELRASIPIGILVLKQGIRVTFLYSILGNAAITVPVYFFLEPFSRAFGRFSFMRRFFDWLYRRAKKKSYLVERYEMFGLALLVGIPLPGTGVWTGCLVASLLRMKFLPTFLACVLGVLLAGIVVTIVTVLGKAVW